MASSSELKHFLQETRETEEVNKLLLSDKANSYKTHKGSSAKLWKQQTAAGGQDWPAELQGTDSQTMGCLQEL